MTNKEAIEIISKEYKCVDRDCDIERSCGKCDLMMPSKEPILQAYKMAIKALKQESSGDLISRQAALSMKYRIDDSATLSTRDVVNVDDIEDLPSVNSQEPRWISVSERLPNRDEYIASNGLFIVSDGNRSYAEYFDMYDSQKYFGEPTMEGFKVDRCVTKWMPLPPC